MKKWLRRLWRLWEDTRIRLPRRGVSATDLHPGDWVQVAGDAWCVKGSMRVGSRSGLLLLPRTRRGVPRCLVPPESDGPWQLEGMAGWLDIDAEDILIFPASDELAD